MIYFAAFVIAFFLAAALMPYIRLVAQRRGWIDKADGRKIHTGEIPRLGGIGIAFGFIVSATIMSAIILCFGDARPRSWRVFFLLGGALAVHGLGLFDDFSNLRARFKFIFQTLIAIMVVAAGYGFTRLYLPGIGNLDFGIFGPVITVFWIVGVMNALNLIDGMDGLAGGIAFIGIAVWGILLFKAGLRFEGMLAASIGGAVLGFLFFNFPPASIFMGDSGSLLLGYMLAILPLLADGSTAGGMRLMPAITVVFIPILDTFAAMIRRRRQGVSFFTPDRYHVHHKLLDLGVSTRSILVLIYGLTIILGASVLASVYANPVASLWFMIAGWVVSGGGFIVLHFLRHRGEGMGNARRTSNKGGIE